MPAANPQREEDLVSPCRQFIRCCSQTVAGQNRIKEFIRQTETTALEAQNRAANLEEIIKQKDSEAVAMREAMAQREETAKAAMASMIGAILLLIVV